MGGNPTVPNVSNITELQQKQGIDILRCLAHDSLTPTNYDVLYLDLFSSAGGYSSSVDTGNTTATYDNTNKRYTNSSLQTDSQSAPSGTSGGANNWNGYKVIPNVSCSLYQVIIGSGYNPTTARVWASDGSTKLGTATFSGNTATFSPAVSLTSGSTYYIAVSSLSGTYTSASGGGNTGTVGRFNFQDKLYSNASTNDPPTWNGGASQETIASLVTYLGSGVATGKVQTDVINVDGNIAQYSLYSTITTSGAGTVTYDISFDNGSTWHTGKALNTLNSDPNDGTQVIIKINLNGTTGADIATSANYALLVWYS